MGDNKMQVMELENLTKYYGKVRGIEDITLNVEEGEIFGFIGPNGAGKSTTIRTVLDLIHPTKGSARIFGMDCQKEGERIRSEVGYLPGEVFYYDRMKVGELLHYAASFYQKDCGKRIEELSAYMELDLGRRIEDLSLGNKKKVGIVQGLLHSPKLILLDEPTTGLDPLMQQKFFQLLLMEQKRGATIFFSSHILSEVQRLCSRVAIVRDGSIASVQTISNLRENSYQKVRFTAESYQDGSFTIPGVSQLAVAGNEVSFLYRGNVNRLLAELAALPLCNVWIEEPSLEEIFLHYYKGDSDEYLSV